MRVPLIIFFGFCAGRLFAQTLPQPAPATAAVQQQSSPAAASDAAAGKANLNPPSVPADDQLKAALVVALQKMSEPKEKSTDWTTIGVALVTLMAGFIAQFFAARVALRQEIAKIKLEGRNEQEKAKVETTLDYTEKLLELRLRQLNRFYAPFYALLLQSEGVTAKLQEQLVHDEPLRFQWKEISKDHRQLEVKINGAWHEFRLLDQAPALKANENYNELIREILRIGIQLTRIIKEHGGLAAVGPEPSPVYGKYLAHFAILSMIYRGSATTAFSPGSHVIGYYPRELNGVVKQGYDEIRALLKNYETTGAKAMSWPTGGNSGAPEKTPSS
jgi:hypothetical protein